MMSAFLVREVGLHAEREAMVSSCSRSLLSRTERSRASVDSTLMSTYFPGGYRGFGGPRRSVPVARTVG